MEVHESGALAVPRNAFLQPEALVEDLADHRSEVRMRIAERRAEAGRAPVRARRTRLPTSSRTCRRRSIRRHARPARCSPIAATSCADRRTRADLLIELGIAPDMRPHVIGLVDGSERAEHRARIGRRDGQGDAHRSRAATPARDASIPPGCRARVNVVIAKSDAAALGVHGIAIQRVTVAGRGDWDLAAYREPAVTGNAASGNERPRRSPQRRDGRDAARAQGCARTRSPRRAGQGDRRRAGVDRRQHGRESSSAGCAGSATGTMGRPALTFNGEPATIPTRLPDSDRTAVSFLLEEDRARAFTRPLADRRPPRRARAASGRRRARHRTLSASTTSSRGPTRTQASITVRSQTRSRRPSTPRAHV